MTKVCFYSPETFAEAKAGVEDAAYLSSVDTQLELGKRVPRPNSKYLDSDSDDNYTVLPKRKKSKITVSIPLFVS